MSFKLPLYISTIHAGFPSPAESYVESKIDLNEFLVDHPAATFLVRAKGDSMFDCGISDGDILVVDRSVEPKDNSIIIAVLSEEFTVKRLKIKKGEYYLFPENQEYREIKVTEDMEFEVWGVVTKVIKDLS